MNSPLRFHQMKKMKNRVMNSLRSWWSQKTPSVPTRRQCCVSRCDNFPLIVVAAEGSTETRMCLGHARECIPSDIWAMD